MAYHKIAMIVTIITNTVHTIGNLRQNMTAMYVLLLSWLLPCGAQLMDDMQIFELECQGENKFQCMTGGCVNTDQYCDGIMNCPDGTDEYTCQKVNILLVTEGQKPDPEKCIQSHHFLCADGRLCLPNSWICNNYTECYDGSDELNCTKKLEIKNDTTCKGFLCDGKKCISPLWVCDGIYDCLDKSDEYFQDQCKHSLLSHTIYDGLSCQEVDLDSHKYRCIDSSFCLPMELMCDGMADCRDGSDEGPFCDQWNTTCDNDPCKNNDTRCFPDRYGPSCVCTRAIGTLQYNFTTNKCEDIDECTMAMPQCSHMCHNKVGRFQCTCDDGYVDDRFQYLCYAKGPEGLLFYSTKNEIGYIKVKTKQRVTVATGIKQGHGVTYDGKHLFWVETADGHQAILRAELDNMQDTKQVIIGLGIEEPGDIALDWLGDHIYFSDSERGIIAVCRTDGSICTILPAHTKTPKFVTLAVRHGTMYWADWHHRPVIMSARMDGTGSDYLVDNLQGFATGLAMDVPNDRLYYVDHTIKVVKVDDKQIYSLFDEPFHHPYAIAVFENTVFWSDWTSHSIQTVDKMHGTGQKRGQLAALDTSVFDMHIYHPVMMIVDSNPCLTNNCSHMCLITSNTTYACACPDGMKLNKTICHRIENYTPLSLVIGSGSVMTRVEYDTLGSAETHTTHFDIGWVQAMAYDSSRDILYLYDGQRKIISNIDMIDFSLGVTRPYFYKGLLNVIEMDYDYVTDNLYILDAGRRFIEAISLHTGKRVLLHRFKEHETPLSFCVVPEYGKMLVAVQENEDDKGIHIDSMGLDGSGREHIVINDLKGPRVRVRYAHNTDTVYVSDDGNSAIFIMNPEGAGREIFRQISTSISTLAVTDTYAFWTDRRTPRLFWAPVHDVAATTRRLPLSIFPNNTQLHIQATFPPLSNSSLLKAHPCHIGHPCSDVCLQTPHPHPHTVPVNFYLGYKCQCPPGLLMTNGTCNYPAICKENEIYCHKSNKCIPDGKHCDGKKDCALGEDEEGCDDYPSQPDRVCPPHQILCNGKCINENESCKHPGSPTPLAPACEGNQFQCYNSSLCVERSQVCDGEPDCPNKSDEDAVVCDKLLCHENEFMCTSGSCILKSFKCDGESDCTDGSDEADCKKTCMFGYYQCRNTQCVEISKRCDGHNDCYDFSDEEQCEESVTMPGETLVPHCAENEYPCELNRSICLPFTARCNFKTECPGGTDETGCDMRCAPHNLFECKQELSCLSKKRVCNGINECLDGSDETQEACSIVNKTSSLFPPPLYPASECRNGFLCKNGQCIEWVRLCDQEPNCFDGSDEGGRCLTACDNHTCTFNCQPTPSGPRCMCPYGFKTHSDGQTCVDVDECANDACTQRCVNLPGSFLCSCYHGYALRADRRSCKAVKGRMSILYVSGNTVRSISALGKSSTEYNGTNSRIVDIDINIRKNKLYVTFPDAKKLVEVNKHTNNTEVTNIGRPTRVSVDWLTGNVYFVDNNATNSHVRVCNLVAKKCAQLQRLPLGRDSNLTSFIVDPANRRMFYCITSDKESVIWSASLAGHDVIDLTTVRNCTGLAVDSFRKRLYVAETYPALITRMDFEGDRHKKVIFGHPELQAPIGLELFEDSIFFLDANSSKLSRCQLLGIDKQCEPFIYRMFDANTFVIRHESVQREDLKNECEGYVCSNVCALDVEGPSCLCNDGSVSKDKKCPTPSISELPLFNGAWDVSEGQESHSSAVRIVVITLTVALIVAYLALYGYYHFVYRARKNRQSTYMEVRFQNAEPSSASVSSHAASTTEMPTQSGSSTESTPGIEFVNPLQYVKKESEAMDVEDVKVSGDTSETESDLDERETQRIVKE
ncbi:putative vitellogenin receptor yl [Aphomia sociella]